MILIILQFLKNSLYYDFVCGLNKFVSAFIDIYNDAPSKMVGLSTPSVGDQVTWVDFKDVKEERGEAGLLKK